MRKLFCVGVILAIISCKQKPVYENKATQQCNNLKFSVGRLFPKETIKLQYNGKLILEQKIDSLDGFNFQKDFCINYTKKGVFKVQSMHNGKAYIDTTFTVYKKDFGYILAFSLPHPKNWKEYVKKNGPLKEWGYLPIDSCVRLLSFWPDTVFRHTFID